MKYLVATSADRIMKHLAMLKSWSIAAKLYPKIVFQRSHFIKSLSCLLCVLRKFNGLRDILGWITCTILKDKAPRIDSRN